MTNRAESSFKPAIRPSLAPLLFWFTCLSVQGAEYYLSPAKKDRTQVETVVCCSSRAGWQGWKDDPHYRDRIKRLDPYSKGLLQTSVSFHQPNCKQGPECPYLALETRGRDSRGKPDVRQGPSDFLSEREQPQDLSPRNPPCIVVSNCVVFKRRLGWV
jgi:hypothetical protein